MQTFSKGQFIRWSNTDEDGKFSYIGQVISHTKGRITFTDTSGGQMSVPEDDGTFEVCNKPHNWSITKPTKKKDHKPVVIQKPTRRTLPKSSETKLDLVVKLLQRNPPVDRKDAIEKIVAAGISTAAGASTYYNSAKGLLS